MLRRSLWLCALLVPVAPMYSQPSPEMHGVPRTEFSVYGGYSLLAPNLFTGIGGDYGPESGWNAGIDLGLVKHVALAADFSEYFAGYGAYWNHTRPFVVMTGPRVWVPFGNGNKMRPFADFLVGGAHIEAQYPGGGSPFQNSATPAFNAGGGVDVKASGHMWFRAQVGYLHTGFTTQDNQLRQGAPPGRARVVLGILYRR